MVFLSFGAGVQSSVMLMLAIKDEIERPDHVIWADTGFEPAAVYRHVEWAKRQCEKARLPFHAVKAPMNMLEEFEAFERNEAKHWNTRPPFYVLNVADTEYVDDQGKRFAIRKGRGTMIRQCTRDAKIKPIERKQKELMGHMTARTIQDGAAIVQIGISTDEARRASPSTTRWIDRSYPLIDPMKMSRNDCQSWWEEHYPHVNLPSSSCVICPYKTPVMWKRMKEADSEDWEKAVEYDDRMRAAFLRRTKQEIFVYRDFMPLKEANLNEAQGSLDLEDDIYCAGGCGL